MTLLAPGSGLTHKNPGCCISCKVTLSESKRLSLHLLSSHPTARNMFIRSAAGCQAWLRVWWFQLFHTCSFTCQMCNRIQHHWGRRIEKFKWNLKTQDYQRWLCLKRLKKREVKASSQWFLSGRSAHGNPDTLFDSSFNNEGARLHFMSGGARDGGGGEDDWR